jgi:hypothetical protein
MKARNEKQRKLALAYQRTFFGDTDAPHIDGEAVLADLRKQACLGDQGVVINKATGMVDPHATCYRAGLRDMYLRLVGLLGIDERTTFTEERADEPTVAHT